MIYETNRLIIYFGDTTDGINKAVDCVPTIQSLTNIPKFASVAQLLNVQELSFAHQVHSVAGIQVQEQSIRFDQEADFLWTNQKNIGIGVMTADCLPIVIYDQKKHIAAIIHAGWPGTLGNIVKKTMQTLQEKCATQVNDLQIFFGPSAKPCCYMVSEDFLSRIPSIYLNQVVEMRDNKLFFNIPKFNELQMQEMGISRDQLIQQHNHCTICDYQFFSHRRQGASAGRQMSVISLK